jgi:hypothetical protein
MFQGMPNENASYSLDIRAYLLKIFSPQGQRFFGSCGFPTGLEIPFLGNLETLRGMNAP